MLSLPSPHDGYIITTLLSLGYVRVALSGYIVMATMLILVVLYIELFYILFPSGSCWAVTIHGTVHSVRRTEKL